MTHDEITKHGANIIDLLNNYSAEHKIRMYDVMVVYIEVMKLMRKIAEEEMKKHYS